MSMYSEQVSPRVSAAVVVGLPQLEFVGEAFEHASVQVVVELRESSLAP